MAFKPILAPFSIAQRNELRKIGNDGIKEIDQKYSTGWPHFRGGSEKVLWVHNGWHGRAVRRGSLIAADQIGMPQPEKDTLEPMALVHDIIQQKPRGVMERESGEWLAERIRKSHILPEELAEIGSLVIRGTEPILRGNLVIGQMCDRLHYPSKSVELMAKSVGCGDFADLNSRMGAYQGHMLAKEYGVPWEKMIEWQIKEIRIREETFTKLPIRKAEKTLWRHKKQIIPYCHQVLKRLQAGEISSFDQLIQEDLAFMRKLS